MDQALKKRYAYWEWRTIIVLMIGYLLFYFVRKNFSIVMPAMEAELGISKVKLGIFLTLNGIIYGLSRFINGFIADRVSRKKMMALGLALSALVNILIGLSPALNGVLNLLDGDGKATMGLIWIIGSLWLLNGYTQGMGYPPCGSLMAHWIRPSELATKQSIWNASHSIGAGAVAVICGFILNRWTYSAWQWCFFVPAILALFGAAILLLGLRDDPASVGLPDPHELDREDGFEAPAVKKQESEEESKAIYNTLLKEMVFRNKIIWILAVTNFCVYVIRFTILDWGATFLTQYKNMSIASASSVVAASEIVGGIIGTLVAGWVTDKYFKSRAHRTCLVGIVLSTLSFFLFWKTPGNLPWLSVTFLIMSSFFIYGPQALTGIAASNQATRRTAASANGIMGIFGYASTTVSGAAFGLIAHKFGWNTVFLTAIVFGIIGAIVIATIWNAPADGYAKAGKIIGNMKKQDRQA
ncbi:MAG: MFS transporter [Bacteroidales bacterium]|nr:MFS transporter [Bacteroidales bacterium]